MLTNKHIDKIVSVLVILAVAACLAAVVFASRLTVLAGGTGISMEYGSKLFNPDSPLTVHIAMEEAEWEKMLSNATQETYYQCDVQIDGKTFYRVGIRPKGNTSLSSIAMDPDTDRFSFKLEFDQFVKDQDCYGLDKLILNNNYADATNMKEALVYDMYQYIGADASLYNYASVYVNGDYWGVYLALEAVEDSFLLRNYGVNGGKLYKPEGMGMGGGGGNISAPPERAGFAGGNFEAGKNFEAGGNFDIGKNFETGKNFEAGENFDIGRNFDFGGFSAGGSGGANLNYTDGNLDSYTTIWEGEITETKKADRKRVVSALKNISEGTNLEESMDIDNLLRYMAVHVFSVNSDSLSGSMAHNYYLHEKDGKLNLIPWDYNLILGGMGGMGGGDASGVINDAIDGAFSGTKFFDKLMENETYYNEYHAYLRQLVDAYINGGAFDAFYARTRGILDTLVKTDPTAFYTYEEYRDAADTFYEVVKLRGESVAGQLDGTIPSTQSGQRKANGTLIDTGNLDLSIMGSMDMGNGNMGGGGGFKGFGGGFNFDGGFVGDSSFTGGDGFAGGNGFTDGNGFDPPQSGKRPPGEVPSPQAADGNAPQSNGQGDNFAGQQPFRSERPDREKANFEGFPGGNPEKGAGTTVMKNLIAYGISFLILLLALIFAMLFKRKSRWK